MVENNEIEIEEEEYLEFKKWKDNKPKLKQPVKIKDDEPEPFEVADSLVTEEPEIEDDKFTCSNCGYDKIDEGIEKCPKCGAKLEWLSS